MRGGVLLIGLVALVAPFVAPIAGAKASALLDPLPMSDVTLTGDWAEAQRRNQEVLLSLDMSRWACHFTTTANLTSCGAAAPPWHTLIKKGASFEHLLGFLAAGDDVVPPEPATVSSCIDVCSRSPSCQGCTFQGTQPGPDLPGDNATVLCYRKSTSEHFTPSPKSNCVAEGGKGKPQCSPLPGEMGLGGYYGHYQGHWLSATAFLFNATGNETIRAAAALNVETLAAVMEQWRLKYGEDGYLFPYDPLVWDQLLAGLGAGPYYTVPFYTLHKLMAGLLDQWEFSGNAKAFEMVKKMAEWVRGRVEATLASGGEELWQRVLQVEWGGMNDVLFHLYDHTRDPSHLSTARRFNSYVFTAPLATGNDELSSLPFPHANFRLPSVVGHARAHELTGNATDAMIVESFLGAVVSNHSYATGGSSSGECWQEPRDLGAFLDDQTQESCTQFNVLKVARRAFLSSGDAKLADFYERAVLNGIVGNQDRRGGAEEATSYIYMQPLGGPNFKPWGKSDFGFPCCWGTLSEAFGKLSDSIFFASSSGSNANGPPSLYVNQFVSATARLQSLGLPGVSVEQKALFPSHPTKTSTLTVHGSGEFSMMIRVPGWSDPSESSVKVNGASTGSSGGLEPGSYLHLQRTWVDGDTVEASFPLRVWSDPINDYHPEYNATIAFMYGPLVLAGVHMETDVWVPKGGPEAAKDDPASFITLNSTAVDDDGDDSSNNKLEFEAEAADGSKMKMIPLKDVMDERYVVYFMTAGTKPPQPEVVYCPHSAPREAKALLSSSSSSSGGSLGLVGSSRLPGGVNDHDQDLVSRGAPSSAPPAAATRNVVIHPPLHHIGDEPSIDMGPNDA